MRRREFIAGLGSAAAWPMAARAQQGERRIGVLMGGFATDTDYQSDLAAFIAELRRLGWTEGRNLRIDVRWNDGDDGFARSYAAQLIRLKPDVILAHSALNLTVIQQATRTVPVVFLRVSDPVAQGFVASMRQPGGNVTGFSRYEFSIGGKWLDLLKGAAPHLARIAVLSESQPQDKFFMQAIEAAALSLGVEVTAVLMQTDIEPALANFARTPNGGLLVLAGPVTRHKMSIADLATRYRLPSISDTENFAKDGGLMQYGSRNESANQFRQAATYVDRIFKGAKPGDLEQPDKYRLVINMKTAKMLGLTVPQSLLALADEVIE
jgi:putative tryptophan/tyrosine transport system substrate-binding protein